MYLGKLCEVGPSEAVYRDPAHPYTSVLLASIPVVPADDAAGRRRAGRRSTGEPPSPVLPPSGCRFHTRCPAATDECATTEPRAAGDRRRPLRGLPPPPERPGGGDTLLIRSPRWPPRRSGTRRHPAAGPCPPGGVPARAPASPAWPRCPPTPARPRSTTRSTASGAASAATCGWYQVGRNDPTTRLGPDRHGAGGAHRRRPGDAHHRLERRRDRRSPPGGRAPSAPVPPVGR